MPKSRVRAGSRAAKATKPDTDAAAMPRASVEIRSPTQIARDAADALFRAALECCHQHDRASRVHEKSALEAELLSAQQACAHCDEALRTFLSAYEQTAAAFRPSGDDEPWWHRANTLWLASREYLRRNRGCDAASKEFKEHGPDQLDALHMEYELEASALLSLRHAAEAYKESRPTAA
jgi:hypothetical protein